MRENIQHLIVFEILRRRSDTVESAPTFLGVNIAHPSLVFQKHIGVHVERAWQYKTFVKASVIWTGGYFLGVVNVFGPLSFAVMRLHVEA